MVTLYLLRHAEKTAQEHNPGLSTTGIHRTEHLARWFRDKSLEAVYSTDFRRTLHTATPLAKPHGLTVQLYPPKPPEHLAARLLSARQNAVVVGHSNTIPQLAILLTGLPIAPMPDTEYDLIYIITLGATGTVLRMMNQRRDLFSADFES